MDYVDINNATNMTQLTREKYDLALSNLTLSKAEHELRENAQSRSVKEILAKVSGVDEANTVELSNLIKNKLLSLIEDQSGESVRKNKDAIRKNVGNWLADGTRSVSKANAIQLAFALDLSLFEADVLIMQLCGERLHWRDPTDLIYGFALNTGRTYHEANRLYLYLESKGIFNYFDEDTSVMTENVEYDLLRITTPEDLERYLVDHKTMLGKFHNTARKTAKELLEFLKQPIDYDYLRIDDTSTLSNRKIEQIDETYTVQEIIKEHLYGEIIPHTKRKADGTPGQKLVLDALQKCIWDGWPEETKMSRMMSGEFDVSRKVLILLFMATDGASTMYSDWQSVPQEEIFEDRLYRLNTMLVDCGYALLDPRAPFDWMIIYCLCHNDGFIDHEKIQNLLIDIFTGKTE